MILVSRYIFKLRYSLSGISRNYSNFTKSLRDILNNPAKSPKYSTTLVNCTHYEYIYISNFYIYVLMSIFYKIFDDFFDGVCKYLQTMRLKTL